MHAEFLTQAPTPATPGVTCVIDTGVNANPDNDASVIGRQTVYPGDGSDGDPDAHHGTYLAMNIAAPANGWGMIGIAPQTRILSIRAIDNGAHNFLSSAYQEALDRCEQAKVRDGVNVTTALLALGHADTDTTADGQAVQNKIDELGARGISVVAAAGNDGGGVQWPARYGPAFAVGASDANGGFCDSASRGSALDLSALGCGDDSALWDTGAPATIDGLEHQRRPGRRRADRAARLQARADPRPGRAAARLHRRQRRRRHGHQRRRRLPRRRPGRDGRRLPPPDAGAAAHARRPSPSAPFAPMAACSRARSPSSPPASASTARSPSPLTRCPPERSCRPALSAAGIPRPAPRSRCRAKHWKQIQLRFASDRRRALPHAHRPPARRCASSTPDKHHRRH